MGPASVRLAAAWEWDRRRGKKTPFTKRRVLERTPVTCGVESRRVPLTLAAAGPPAGDAHRRPARLLLCDVSFVGGDFCDFQTDYDGNSRADIHNV